MPFFQEAERVIVNGGNFIDSSSRDITQGKGIELLLKSVQCEAIHDSDSRGALGCHPDTREDYIRSITSWGSGRWESEKRAFMMTGPAGAGKSAIARTCAYNIEEVGNLGASFFFFRPSGWNDPKKFIPTIVYQLTTRFPAYHDCIDAVISRDRLVLEKAMPIQFRELVVKPLQKLNADGHSVGKDMVIVIDGLDECRTVDAQIEIIELIATSIHEQTTPFLWAFFSRPEPPITSSFESRISSNISWRLPLTLSGKADNDIEAYLRGSFGVIRAKHRIPVNVTWPLEKDISRLVSQSAGLFAYAVTAIRYIDGYGNGTSGLDNRLQVVLQLDPASAETPFSTLDQLYTLLMMQIPQGVLSVTLSLLCLYLLKDPDSSLASTPPAVRSLCFALSLSSTEFHEAISNLYSVLEVTMSGDEELEHFQFYHRSFLDFLLDPKRSQQFFIKSPSVRQRCLLTTMGTLVDRDKVWKPIADSFVLQAFFLLVEEHDGQLEETVLRQISQFNWKCLRHLRPNAYDIYFIRFIEKIPSGWRSMIVRQCRNQSRSILCKIGISKRTPQAAYTLGKGDKESVIALNENYRWAFR